MNSIPLIPGSFGASRRQIVLLERTNAEWRNLISPCWDEFKELYDKHGLHDLRAREETLAQHRDGFEKDYRRYESQWITTWNALEKPYEPRIVQIGDTEVRLGGTEEERLERLHGTLVDSEARMQDILTEWDRTAVKLETLRFIVSYAVQGNPMLTWDAGESPYTDRQKEYIVNGLQVFERSNPRYLEPFWKGIAGMSRPTPRGTTVKAGAVRDALVNAGIFYSNMDLAMLKANMREAVDLIAGEGRRREAVRAIKENVIARLEDLI